MEYEDRLAIATPEGVELELELAGLGSRFAARLIDLLLQIVLTVALLLACFGIGRAAGVESLGAAIYLVLSFAILFGYDVLFEVLAGGRTPGKMATGLRVVRSGGQPVNVRTSSVRNAMRLIDEALTLYLGAAISIVASSRNQRLGDMAAGTLVVRDGDGPPAPRQAATPAPAYASAGGPAWATPAASASAPAWTPPEAAHWDVSAVTPQELAAVRQFLERRWSLDLGARNQLAWQLAESLRGKVAGAPEELRGEPFLERLAAVKTARS